MQSKIDIEKAIQIGDLATSISSAISLFLHGHGSETCEKALIAAVYMLIGERQMPDFVAGIVECTIANAKKDDNEIIKAREQITKIIFEGKSTNV